jgi:lipopolysaccharide transport system permease protein
MSKEETAIEIKPTSGWRFANWRELYAYRDLLRLLVWRDFATRYKQTILGPLWHIIQPLLTTLIFTVIFSHVAELSTDGLPATLFYLCGLLAWNYFAQTFNAVSSTLTANAGLFGKVYFPRLIVPFASVLSGIVSFGIQLGLFIVVFLLWRLSHPGADVGPAWQVVLLPLVLLQLGALSLGVGLWLAALTAKFRDFSVLAGFIIQLWMYVTPVIYPLTRIPAQWRLFAALNPVSIPVESFRLMLLGRGAVSPHLLIASMLVTVFALVSGLMVFQRVEKSFVDVI